MSLNEVLNQDLRLAEGLFPTGMPGEQYEFGKQDTRFSGVAQKILSAADKELTARGLRREVPTGTRLFPILIGAIGAGLALFTGIAALDRGVHPAVPIIVIVASILVVMAVVGMVSRRPLTRDSGTEIDSPEVTASMGTPAAT